MTARKLRFDPASFRRTKPREYATRFCFGGAISALAFLASHWLGPVAGGLLLAFPALLPAALTLADEHEARNAAVVHARAAALGALALLAFASTFRELIAHGAALATTTAVGAWFGSASLMWLLTSRLQKRCAPRSHGDSTVQ